MEAVNTNFFSLLVWLGSGNRTQVYRLRSERSYPLSHGPI